MFIDPELPMFTEPGPLPVWDWLVVTGPRYAPAAWAPMKTAASSSRKPRSLTGALT